MLQKTEFNIKEIGIIRFWIGLVGAIILSFVIISLNKIIIQENTISARYNIEKFSLKLLSLKFIYYFGVAAWASGFTILFWGEMMKKPKRIRFHVAVWKSRMFYFSLIFLPYILYSVPELYLINTFDSNAHIEIRNLILMLVPLVIFSNNWNDWRRMYNCKKFYSGSFILSVIFGIIFTLIYAYSPIRPVSPFL